MRMAAHLKNVNLPPNLVHDVETLNAALTDDLHRHLLVCQSVLGDCSASFRGSYAHIPLERRVVKETSHAIWSFSFGVNWFILRWIIVRLVSDRLM